jgi:hypothetical protein
VSGSLAARSRRSLKAVAVARAGQQLEQLDVLGPKSNRRGIEQQQEPAAGRQWQCDQGLGAGVAQSFVPGKAPSDRLADRMA